MHGRDQRGLVASGGRAASHVGSRLRRPSRQAVGVRARRAQAGQPEELELIKTLIEASTEKKLDMTRYKDTYIEKLTALMEAKVKGKEIVAPPVQEHPQGKGDHCGPAGSRCGRSPSGTMNGASSRSAGSGGYTAACCGSRGGIKRPRSNSPRRRPYISCGIGRPPSVTIGCGRPCRSVHWELRSMPRWRYTVAPRSDGVTRPSLTSPPLASVLPTTCPWVRPPPATSIDMQLDQCSRPPVPLCEKSGDRPNSPSASTRVSSSRPRASRSLTRAYSARSSRGSSGFNPLMSPPQTTSSP